MFRERFSFSHQQDLPTRAALFFEHSPTSLLPLISLLSSLWAHSPSDPKTSSFIISSAGACCQMSPTLTHLYHTLFCFVCLSGNQITYISHKPACKHTTGLACRSGSARTMTQLSSSHPPLGVLLILSPLNLSPLSHLPSSPPALCVRYVFSGCVSFHTYLTALTPSCLLDMKFPLSVALKGSYLFVLCKAPVRALCQRSPVGPLGNNTPSECLEFYTTRISSSLSVVYGLRVCHSSPAWA